MRQRVFLISGMAGDSRLFRSMTIPGVDLITPDHVEPKAGENLADYAERVAAKHGIHETDVIGGSSFGGMIVSQIASRRKVAGLILLGTCLNPRTLPKSYRLLEALGPLIPDALLHLRAWPPLMRLRFSPLTPGAEACLTEMTRTFPSSFIRRFGRMLMTWPGVAKPNCPTIVVHGDRDLVIPIACSEPDVVLSNAGHVFTLTHPEETSAAIASFLEKLHPPRGG